MTGRVWWIVLSSCGVGLVTATPASAQEPDSGTAATGTLIPLPVLFYQPETGTGFGAAASYYFRTATGAAARPSDVTAVGIYTTRRQIIASVATQLYLQGDRLRLRGEAGFLRFPTKFWGIGNDTPDAAEEDYTPDLWIFGAESQRQIAPAWYAGGTLQVAHRRVREREEGGLLDGSTVPGAGDGRIVSTGLLVTRDTRDNVVFPHAGQYFRAAAAVAAAALGSDFTYTSFTLDGRWYFPAYASHVVALRMLGEARTGTPPFDLLPQLGGERLLRGYYQGRFRDHVLLAAQAEYRALVFWRIGIAGFVAAGQVAPDLGALGVSGFKPAAGVGVRFQISRQEELSIRADYGWGFDVGSSGFYLSLGEAF